MKTSIIAVAVLVFSLGAVQAQPPQQSTDSAAAAAGGLSRPTIGMGSKTMDSCALDKQRVCSTATEYMTKECLVKNWDNISSNCQDALGTPFDGVSRSGG